MQRPVSVLLGARLDLGEPDSGWAASCASEVPLQVSGVVVGEGYRFGYKAQGDTDTLKALCAKHGLEVQVAALLTSSAGSADSVSSSKALPCDPILYA